MAWEGIVEGFGPIRVKSAIGRSGVIPMYMFPNEAVGNPAITSKVEIVTPIKKTVIITSFYEVSVE